MLLNIENGRAQIQKLPYPKRVFLILAAVFGERFNYFGMQSNIPISGKNSNCYVLFIKIFFVSIAILVLYLKNKLSYSENDATMLYHANSVLVNFMCIFGGILSDVWLGRFMTIWVLSIVYCCASALIAMSSMPLIIFSPNTALIIGLVLVSIGGGGMQPCIAAFGADQFKIPEQSAYVATYFSLFYASLNTGAFLSHAIPPILRSEFHCFGENDCYPLGFGVPTILLFIAIGEISLFFSFASGQKSTPRQKLNVQIVFQHYFCVENRHTRMSQFHLRMVLEMSTIASW